MTDEVIESLKESQLDAILKQRFGYHEDELKTLAPDEAGKRKLLKDCLEAVAFNEDADDDDASEDWDSEDDTELSPEEVKEAAAIKETKAERKKILEQRKKELENLKNDVEVKQSLAETKAEVTIDDVRAAREDLKALMADWNDDEEDEQ